MQDVKMSPEEHLNLEPEMLFHYCTASTFVSIITKQTIRLSSLKSSNDHTEGTLVSESIGRACQSDGLGSDFARYIIDQAETTQEMNSGKGFCLSTNRDLLSQWRAYGGDGTGFSIGFSTAYLKKFISHYSAVDPTIMLIPVIYDLSEHDSTIYPIYTEIKPTLDKNPRWVGFSSGALSPNELEEFQRFYSAVYLNSTKSNIHLYRLKHPSFSEESEWRIVTLAKNIAGNAEEYLESNGVIKEYISLPMIDLGENIITKVILGPKTKNSSSIVSELLWNNGFAGVEILSSNIPYK